MSPTCSQHELGFGIGPAGTGKTYLAVAVGVTMFISGAVEKIILSRPAVEAGERLGFLPGDMKEKVDPYMQPLYDALNDFLPAKQVQKLLEEKRIEIAPLAFMRGRTLSNAFVVLDEAQNATTMQMKMFLTRLGEGSRMVITGDRTQVDLPRGVPSGLAEAERILKGVEGRQLQLLHLEGRGAPSAGRPDHRGLRGGRSPALTGGFRTERCRAKLLSRRRALSRSSSADGGFTPKPPEYLGKEQEACPFRKYSRAARHPRRRRSPTTRRKASRVSARFDERAASG